MFQINGRTFALREDSIINLKSLGIECGFSLYNTKSKQYICSDKDGNVKVKAQEKYIIRRVFPKLIKQEEENKIIKKEKDTSKLEGLIKNNPYMKFCQDYRAAHPGEKIQVETISEQWKKLDEKTKREKYGYATIKTMEKEKKEGVYSNNNNNNKRKRNDDDNKETIIKAKRGRPKNKEKNKTEIHKDDNVFLVKNQEVIKKETNKNEKKHDSLDSLFNTDSDSD